VIFQEKQVIEGEVIFQEKQVVKKEGTSTFKREMNNTNRGRKCYPKVQNDAISKVIEKHLFKEDYMQLTIDELSVQYNISITETVVTTKKYCLL